MSFSTRPGYTASSQAAITSEIPDSDDGCIAYAIAEGTAWQLQKSGVPEEIQRRLQCPREEERAAAEREALQDQAPEVVAERA